MPYNRHDREFINRYGKILRSQQHTIFTPNVIQKLEEIKIYLTRRVQAAAFFRDGLTKNEIAELQQIIQVIRHIATAYYQGQRHTPTAADLTITTPPKAATSIRRATFTDAAAALRTSAPPAPRARSAEIFSTSTTTAEPNHKQKPPKRVIIQRGINNGVKIISPKGKSAKTPPRQPIKIPGLPLETAKEASYSAEAGKRLALIENKISKLQQLPLFQPEVVSLVRETIKHLIPNKKQEIAYRSHAHLGIPIPFPAINDLPRSYAGIKDTLHHLQVARLSLLQRTPDPRADQLIQTDKVLGLIAKLKEMAQYQPDLAQASLQELVHLQSELGEFTGITTAPHLLSSLSSMIAEIRTLLRMEYQGYHRPGENSEESLLSPRTSTWLVQRYQQLKMQLSQLKQQRMSELSHHTTSHAATSATNDELMVILNQLADLCQPTVHAAYNRDINNLHAEARHDSDTRQPGTPHPLADIG